MEETLGKMEEINKIKRDNKIIDYLILVLNRISETYKFCLIVT